MTDALAINLAAPCWLYTGARRNGYAYIRRNGFGWYGHRYIWQLMRGPIPQGFELDHMCRVRHCVNPQHLEIVTHAENVRRGIGNGFQVNAAKTHCPQGHPYDQPNTLTNPKGWRWCRACKAEYYRTIDGPRRAAARRAARKVGNDDNP